jgi:hypothetical protein
MLDPATGRLRIASAGHLPPVVAAPGRPSVLAEIAVGVPIGVADNPARQTTTMCLSPGTVLCLYTDGLVERRTVPIDDRLDLLRRTVSPGPPENVCISVMLTLVGNEPVRDDVAVLVMRWEHGGPLTGPRRDQPRHGQPAPPGAHDNRFRDGPIRALAGHGPASLSCPARILRWPPRRIPQLPSPHPQIGYE